MWAQRYIRTTIHHSRRQLLHRHLIHHMRDYTQIRYSSRRFGLCWYRRRHGQYRCSWSLGDATVQISTLRTRLFGAKYRSTWLSWGQLLCSPDYTEFRMEMDFVSLRRRSAASFLCSRVDGPWYYKLGRYHHKRLRHHSGWAHLLATYRRFGDRRHAHK